MLLVFARDLYCSWSWKIIKSSIPMRYLTAIQPGSQNTHCTRHGQQRCHCYVSQKCPTCIMMSWCRSIYGVVVINGSLYSRFYSMALSDGKQSFDPCPIVLVSIFLQFQPDTNKFSCLQLEAEKVNITYMNWSTQPLKKAYTIYHRSPWIELCTYC